MSDSLPANVGDDLPSAVRPSEDDRPPLTPPPAKDTPNFSRPLPLSPHRALQSPAPPVIGTAQATSSGSLSTRPLPSVPYVSSQSPEPTQGGRGSGLGTRIIDDRDPADFLPPAPLAPTQSPSRGLDEDERTSTAASDSELLYASAPSSPLPAPGDLEQEETEPRDVAHRIGAHGGQHHEASGRRATVALGEGRRDHSEGAPIPKRAATVDHYTRETQEQRIPVTQVHEDRRTLQRSDTSVSVGSEGSSEDMDPYLRRIMEHFAGEPNIPTPLGQASVPSFPEPQRHPQSTILGLPVPEPHTHSSVNETAAFSMPSAIAFPMPGHERHDTSSTIHGSQGPGGSSDTSRPLAPSVIAGTNLEFEPLPPYRRATSPESSLTRVEVPTHTHTPARIQSHTHTHRPLPAFPPRSSSLPPTGQDSAGKEGREGPGSIIITGSGNGPTISGTGIVPTAPLRISKNTRTSSSSPGIPPGAAAPTPPASSSSPDLPKRLRQELDVNVSRSPSTLPQEKKDPLSAIDHATVTPLKHKQTSTDADTSIAKQGSRHVTRGRGLTTQKASSSGSSPSPTHKSPLSAPRKLVKPAPKRNASTGSSSNPRDEEVPRMSTTSMPEAPTGRGEKEEGPSAVKKEAEAPGPGKPVRTQTQTQNSPQSQTQSQMQEAQAPAQDPTIQRNLHAEPQSHHPQSQSQPQRPAPSQPSHPPSSPSHSKPPPPSDPNAATAPLIRRTSHAEYLSHQPRTLAEEKAQYNAVPPSSRSRYMNMLLALDDIPTIYNISSSFFTWILLAGFVLFPGTFTSLETLDLGGGIGATLVDRIVNLPLFVIAFVCTGIGIIGMGYLWWKWMKNYIWLVNKIFLPGLMNSLAGIISTVVNVYGVQHGEFNTTSIVTISVTGGVGAVCGILVLWYGVWLLGRVKKQHMKEVGIEKAGKHGEGVWAGFKEKVSKVGRRK